MSPDLEIIPLARMNIRTEPDIVLCRQQARHFAAAMGFDSQTQTRIATSVSEIARNAYQYAGGGAAEFQAETDQGSRRRHDLRQQTLTIVIRDQGPGIQNLDEVLSGGYRSGTGLGVGIMGAHKLMDGVDIQTGATGSTITLRKNLAPGTARKGTRELQALATPTKAPAPAPNVMNEVQIQNRELLAVMEEVSGRQEDLARMNKELEETNAGVLALYDELETLHRVGLLLASKIDLPALIQTLIEATTDLTGAQFGACYLRSQSSSGWERYADAGPRKTVLKGLPKVQEAEFFGLRFGPEGLMHFPDLPAHAEPCSMSEFAEALAPRVTLRSCLAVPVTDADQVLLGALIFGSDEPRIFSERSERIVASIAAQATVAIDKARLFDSVKAASDAKDRFLAMISHELRTPLNPVLSIVSSLHDNQDLPLELREDLAVVLRNVQLEARLIDDLLDFQRIIKGNLSFVAEPVDMHAMIRNVVEICWAEVALRTHHLQMHLEAERCMVLGDAARLQQVLWNILKNAIKFTPPDGTIAVRTRVDAPDTLVIQMRDSGRGIEPELLEGIFSAFEQGSVEGATQFGGLGLGLAIARAFVEKHGGKVVAESGGRNQGATFTVRLPLTASAPSVAPVAAQFGQAGGEVAPAAAAAPKTAGSAGTILLIDDHPDTLWSLERLLKRQGYRVLTAASCAEAIVCAQTENFDAIISDLGLPDGSGLTLITELRAYTPAPSIALSGYGMEADVDQTRAAGFALHLTKPVAFHSLLQAVRGLTDRQ